MNGNDQSFKNKISPIIDGQLPNFVQEDHPLFVTLLKHYYQFMEGRTFFGGFNDYVIQETNSVNYILDENGDNVVLETSISKFETGETIVGDTSKVVQRLLSMIMIIIKNFTLHLNKDLILVKRLLLRHLVQVQ